MNQEPVIPQHPTATATDTLRIALDPLRDDLLALGRIGYNEDDHGIYRSSYSQADMQSRQWLLQRFAEEGLEAQLDGAGNVIGRLQPADSEARRRPALVIGSHTDSVLSGGLLDGTLGVLAGLAVCRTLRAAAIEPQRPLEIVSFAEEEGRFGGMFGAEAYCGKVTPERIRSAHAADGERLWDAMQAAGLDPMAALTARRSPEDLYAFLELHIEQGPVLDTEQLSIGVVEGISGVFKWVVRLVGRANHAGTAPMHLRSDAFMGLADFAHEIPRIIDEDGSDDSRLTVGRAELKPGHAHTVAGEVEFTLVGRDQSAALMRELAASCKKALAAIARRHGLKFEYEELSWLDPTPCHDDIIELFSRTVKQLGYPWRRMPSGAGHDTQHLAEVTPAGMVFVPSVGGISHAPDEFTHWEDIERGANVLLQASLELLMNVQESGNGQSNHP